MIEGFKQTSALLCFSRNWDNLLLWSHYADCHSGFCLGFDIPDGDVQYDVAVNYQPSLLKLAGPEEVTEQFLNKVFHTKHECWSYEQEIRPFVKLIDEKDRDGRWWFDFGPNLVLKEVIAGVNCEHQQSREMERVVKDQHPDVTFAWAYMKKDAFALIQHDFEPLWYPPAEFERK